MDLTSLIIGLVITAVFVTPILYVSIKQNLINKKLLKQLSDLATRNNSKINQYDVWSKRAIGIDKFTDKLFYVSQDGESSKEVVIDLSKKKACRTNDLQQQKLELIIEDRSIKENDIILCFYEPETDGANQHDKLQLLQKWKLNIENDLKQ